MKKFKLNLRGKIFLVVSIGLLVAYGILGAFRIHQVKIELLQEIERSGQERTALIADAVANMIVGYDYGNLESVASRVIRLQDVQKISILSSTGKLMVSRDSFGEFPENIAGGQEGILFSAPVTFSGDKVGSVELIISRSRYNKLLSENYRSIFVAILGATAFFGLLIYVTVTYFVAVPLTRLSRAADKLALGDFGAELPRVTNDEMGSLVTAFNAMRESRKLSEERLLAVFNNSPDAFIQLDSEGRIINWNDKAADIFGYDKTEVLGKSFSIVMPPPELGMNKGYRSCYQKSENVIGVIRELVGQRKDGSYFPLELRTGELHLDDGIAYLVSARDITERKESESNLLDAMNAAEAANLAKSAFLSNMSHEIRTPMNSIIGMTKLAFKTPLSAKQQDYLNKIDYSANHLLGLINDILDFSKIEANKLELEMRDFDLREVFENLSGQLMHSAASKELGLRFDLDERLSVPLRGDPMRLSQILLNYIGNAIKFTEKGEITVSGKLVREIDHVFFMRFEVRDSGIGMSQKDMDELFIPFHQADASTTRKYGGTGLGLAICKQLAGLMNGEVGVESNPGQGSTFWFTARLERGTGEIVETPTFPNDWGMLKGKRILLVEDNPFNQQVAFELLQEVGVTVKIANNGKEAIDILLESAFDCILMDVQMPVMDGLEATRYIRRNAALAHNCIIAMTANAGRDDRERCFAAGMDQFISKPVFAENLYAVIMTCLSGANPGNAARENFTSPSATAERVQSERDDPSDSLIDLSVLGKMLGEDSVKIRKFALKFLHSAEQGIQEIETALKESNLETVAALGHRSKSPARTVGAFVYADLCQSLEKFKDGGEIALAREIVGQMKHQLKQIAAQINKEISKL